MVPITLFKPSNTPAPEEFGSMMPPVPEDWMQLALKSELDIGLCVNESMNEIFLVSDSG